MQAGFAQILLRTAYFHSLTRESDTQDVQLLIMMNPGVPLPLIIYLTQETGSIVAVST